MGPWLPEPLITDEEPDAAQYAETADSLALAFLDKVQTIRSVANPEKLRHIARTTR